MFEYKFVRLAINIWTNSPKEDYQSIIQEHGDEGWRLVQIFAPTNMNMQAAYYELVFERPKTDLV